MVLGNLFFFPYHVGISFCVETFALAKFEEVFSLHQVFLAFATFECSGFWCYLQKHCPLFWVS